MKTGIILLLTGVVSAFASSEAQAQRFVYRNTVVVPSPYPGNYNYSAFYTNPYGYQAAVTTGVTPTPYGGYNAYTTTTTTVRPVYMSPYVSVIWDPTTLSYRYTTGYANTTNFSYYSSYPGVQNYGLYNPYP
jgi:hypothetical protein